jgi:hypothetical protein
MTNRTNPRLGDRRAKPRFEIVGQLWGALETVETLRLTNLGQGGALLEAHFPLQIDTVHRLRFSSGSRVTDMQACVRHVSAPGAGQDRHGYSIGMEFLPLSPAAVEHVDDLIAANQPGPPGGKPPGDRP